MFVVGGGKVQSNKEKLLLSRIVNNRQKIVYDKHFFNLQSESSLFSSLLYFLTFLYF